MYYRPSHEDDLEEQKLREKNEKSNNRLNALCRLAASIFTVEEVGFLLDPKEGFENHEYSQEQRQRIDDLFNKYLGDKHD